MSPAKHTMTDREYAEYLSQLQAALNTALDVARHVHIEKSSSDEPDMDFIEDEYNRLLTEVGMTLAQHTTAALDYRVDYPPTDEEIPVGFSVVVRVKLEVLPEPITEEERAEVPPLLEDLP